MSNSQQPLYSGRRRPTPHKDPTGYQYDYICPYCGLHYSSYNWYRKHLWREHKEEMVKKAKGNIQFYKCFICGEYISKRKFIDHLKKEHGYENKSFEDFIDAQYRSRQVKFEHGSIEDNIKAIQLNAPRLYKNFGEYAHEFKIVKIRFTAHFKVLSQYKKIEFEDLDNFWKHILYQFHYNCTKLNWSRKRALATFGGDEEKASAFYQWYLENLFKPDGYQSPLHPNYWICRGVKPENVYKKINAYRKKRHLRIVEYYGSEEEKRLFEKREEIFNKEREELEGQIERFDINQLKLFERLAREFSLYECLWGKNKFGFQYNKDEWVHFDFYIPHRNIIIQFNTTNPERDKEIDIIAKKFLMGVRILRLNTFQEADLDYIRQCINSDEYIETKYITDVESYKAFISIGGLIKKLEVEVEYYNRPNQTTVKFATKNFWHSVKFIDHTKLEYSIALKNAFGVKKQIIPIKKNFLLQLKDILEYIDLKENGLLTKEEAVNRWKKIKSNEVYS